MINMYFHEVKSTAHPPIIGALGHSNDCISKQAMKHNSHKYLFTFVQACCVLLEKKLWAEAEAAFTNKQAHRKFKICLACLFPILLSVLCVFVYYSAS